VRKEKKKGELKAYHWTLLGQHVAAVTFGSAVGVTLLVRSLGTLAIANSNVDSLRGLRGNVIIDISVVGCWC
jgi:hypothetical protein